MAEWLNNRMLLDSVGYTRRGCFHDEDGGAARSIRSTGIHKHAYAIRIRAIKSLKQMIDMKHMNHAMRATSKMDFVQLHVADCLNPSWM